MALIVTLLASSISYRAGKAFLIVSIALNTEASSVIITFIF
ncbi:MULTISPECIES: hypothetical protein [unclassified Polaribacter]|jgi:hypothetical protein|nr:MULTISPECIES: hypothetical protein [unclassified Polaribacter]KGL61109.1 hypothetical protein PHEL49_2007 [Polaribacter sp. Hel1_33_49]MDG1194919.1 hypothetical protein [Polaribacter sp.]MDG1403860.1 hypothetical protein [Polaribacter sp.]MDG2437623.1 hypothetical protein [Polaribacter sp.]